MKKVLALALALVMALSMSAMAFAEDTAAATKIVCGFCKSEGFADAAELKEHQATYHAVTEAPEAEETFRNACPICEREFENENEYNAHIQICDVKGNGEETIRADFSIKEILQMIIDIAKSSMSQWDAVESVIIRLIDFVENMGTLAVSEADVKGAVADLEAALADAKIPGVEDLLNQLKQKIKDLYAGEVATTVVEETTAAEEIVETGSSSVGIAVFAAVSVAAAAAYVCTKKSK